MSESTPRTFAWRGRDAVFAVKTFAQRVKRARADVAVNDAEAGQAKQGQARLLLERRPEAQLGPPREAAAN